MISEFLTSAFGLAGKCLAPRNQTGLVFYFLMSRVITIDHF